MSEIYTFRLRRLSRDVSQIFYQMTTIQPASVETWSPAVNVFRGRDAITVCVDLAGVDKEAIELSVEPRRMILRGHREPLEPASSSDQPIQILTLEIDYGPFERVLLLPVDIDPEGVKAEQRNGVLWISLPIQCAA